LIDGGYAHNVPLEAALLTDSRHVLVVNASPLDDEEAPTTRLDGVLRPDDVPSQLVQGASRIFDFLFARAQQLDRAAGDRMFVVSLSPHPRGRWAGLLDFTRATRERMIGEAEHDIQEERRIGHVESWGPPVESSRIELENRESPLRDWQFSTDDTGAPDLAPMPASLQQRRVAKEALLLKMIMEFRYPGDNGAFWSSLSNTRASGVLRSYWSRMARKPLRRYLKPDSWTTDFVDYVVLFWRQYEEARADRGASDATNSWLALLAGELTDQELARIVAELEVDEAQRPAGPILMHSARYGSLRVPRAFAATDASRDSRSAARDASRTAVAGEAASRVSSARFEHLLAARLGPSGQRPAREAGSSGSR
jgi:hypothetical protein